MVKEKVYKGIHALTMMRDHWMINIVGYKTCSYRPIRIINDTLYLLAEDGEPTEASININTILQGEYVIYAPVQEGDWVKVEYNEQFVYGKVYSIRDNSHVGIIGHEGTWFSLAFCTKIPRDEAYIKRVTALFQANNRRLYEFRKGDIVRTKGGTITEVIKITDGGMVNVYATQAFHDKQTLTIIAFAEDRAEVPMCVAHRKPLPSAAPIPQQAPVPEYTPGTKGEIF